MSIKVYTASETGDFPGRVFAVTVASGKPQTLYEFFIEHEDEQHVSFSTAQSFQDDGGTSPAPLCDEIRRAVEGAGYTIVEASGAEDTEDSDDLRTDGGVTEGNEGDESEDDQADAVEAMIHIRNMRWFVHNARDNDVDNAYVKLALGELHELGHEQDIGSPDLQSQLEGVFASPEEEKPYFLNRADEMIDSLAEKVDGGVSEDDVDGELLTISIDSPGDDADAAPEQDPADPVDEIVDDPSEWIADYRPPDSVRWTGKDTGVLEIEVTRSMVEWMELEIEDSNHETIEDWAFIHLFVQLQKNIPSHTADVEIDIPEELAKRIALYCRHFEEQGKDANIPDAIYNHITTRPFYTLNGQPWTLAAEAVDYDYSERPSLRNSADSEESTEADTDSDEEGDHGSAEA